MDRCSSFIIHCMDFRTKKAVDDSINKNLGGIADEVSMPGGAKALLDDQTKEGVLQSIRIAVELHGVRTVLLTAHRDCGAYGGSAAFDSATQEYQQQLDDLMQAGELVRREFPDVAVQFGYFESDDRQSFRFVPIELDEPVPMTA